MISSCLKSTRSHETESPQQLAIKIQPDLFLVSPNLQETKGAELHHVTAENYSTLVTHWKDSKLFDFEFLYKSEEKGICLPVLIDMHQTMPGLVFGKYYLLDAVLSGLDWQHMSTTVGTGRFVSRLRLQCTKGGLILLRSICHATCGCTYSY